MEERLRTRDLVQRQKPSSNFTMRLRVGLERGDPGIFHSTPLGAATRGVDAQPYAHFRASAARRGAGAISWKTPASMP